MTENEKRFVDDIAQALIVRLNSGNHICKYEHEMGRLQSVAQSLEKSAEKQNQTLDKISEAIESIAIRTTKLEQERATLKSVIAFLVGGGFIGWMTTKLGG